MLRATPDLLISRAAMAHNCWFVDFGIQQVPMLDNALVAGDDV